MAETIMVLKVDLGCDRCYRKVKKLLCKFPEIRDQIFKKEEDTVIIKVVCCSPERIRSKLICKGGKTIKSIEIKVPEKPKPPPEKPKEPEKPKPAPEKPKEAEKPKPPPEKPKEDEKPPPAKPKEAEKPPPEKPKEAEKPKPPPEPKPEKPVEKPPPPAPAPAPAPVAGYPQFYPVAVCCKPCYDLGHGGPCQHGCGIPYQPPSSYDGYVRLVPSYDEPYGGWPSRCRCDRSYGCRCVHFTEENPACTIM